MTKLLANTTPSIVQLRKSERSSRRFWVCLICSFFAIDFTVAAIAITMAAGDPSFRSIPGYGERAVAWDIRQQRKLSSQKLRWKVELRRVEPSRDAIEITVLDSANEPVVGCKGAVRVFHFTRVADQHRSDLNEISPGVYRAAIDVTKSGNWQMDLEIHADGDRHYWADQTLNWLEPSAQRSGTNQ